MKKSFFRLSDVASTIKPKMIDLVSNYIDSYPTRINLDQVRVRFGFGNVNVANPVVFENVMDDIKVKSWMDSEIVGS